MRFLDHPSTHGHTINHYTCGSGYHAVCPGFSGGYDTYLCGCCCHDEAIGYELSDEDRARIDRLRARKDGTAHAR